MAACVQKPNRLFKYATPRRSTRLREILKSWDHTRGGLCFTQTRQISHARDYDRHEITTYLPLVSHFSPRDITGIT